MDVLYDGSAAGEQALASDFDAIVFDLMLPGRSGSQVLRDVRARKAELPVLILSAKRSVGDRVAGLDSGAGDYVAKPYETRYRLADIWESGGQAREIGQP